MTTTGLKPQNIVQAAEADLVRRERNRLRVPDESGVVGLSDAMEHYAFHRNHVRKAVSPRDLIRRAIADPYIVVPEPEADAPEGERVEALSRKRNTVIIYSDVDLLADALRLLPEKDEGEYRNGE